MINSSNNNGSNTSNNNNVNGFCDSMWQSMTAIASIYKDSKYIINVLRNDPYSSNFKYSIRRIIIIKILWLLLSIGMELAVSFPFSWIMTALEHKKSSEFYGALRFYFIVILFAGPILAIDSYLTELLYVRFRETTTKILLKRYHSNNNYYHISSCDSVDNPGQRLDQDVDNWTWGTTNFLLLVIKQILRLFGWCAVLWTIGARLIVYGFIVAAFIVTMAITIFASKLTHIAFLISKHGADFRAGIIRTRDNGETIAFYGASKFEGYWNKQRLMKLINNMLLRAQWNGGLEFLQKGTKYIGTILPLILLAPLFINGKLQLGQIMQSCYAFSELLLALTLVVRQMDRLSNIQAGGTRICAVIFAMDQIDKKIIKPPTIKGDIIGSPRSVRNNNNNNNNNDIEPGYLHHAGATDTLYDGIQFNFIDIDSQKRREETKENEEDITTPQREEQLFLLTQNLSVIVPNTHSLLLYKLNMEISQYQNILIVGPSGCGKSSLLRVLCGLWKWGKGSVDRLKNDQCMFLPQKPYLPILQDDKNTLKNQLLFPRYKMDIDNNDNDNVINNEILTLRQFRKTLENINLEYILDYENNVTTDSHDWSKLLSLGEQQRLSFGRVIIAKPKHVFLDEATSALDPNNQSKMYQLLKNENITYLSVGHRTNLIQFHDTVLQIIGDGSWKLWTANEYKIQNEQYHNSDHDSF